MAIPTWLADLIDECGAGANRRSDRAIARLARAFQDEEPGVMEQAILSYMKSSPFFPGIASLTPFVQSARNSSSIQLTDAQLYRRISPLWPICPVCGERVPAPDNCPACADLATMAATS